MRRLIFNIDKQKLSRDSTCDFSDIVRGTSDYLMVKFNFSPDWNRCVTVAVFGVADAEYPVAIVNNECLIPAEVLAGDSFRINVVGQRNKYRILTNTCTVWQTGG